MEAARWTIPAIIKDGVDMTPELKSELDQWDKAGDEAWAMIDQWEAEEL